VSGQFAWRGEAALTWFTGRVWIVAVAVLAGGCQSAEIAHATVHRPIAVPTVAYVGPFDTTRTVMTGDTGDHRAEEVASHLEQRIRSRLAGRGVAVREATAGARPTECSSLDRF
jgi:hypothetical protein